MFLRLPKPVRKVLFGSVARRLPLDMPMRNFMKFVALASPNSGVGALGIYPYIKDDLLTSDLRKELSDETSTVLQQELLAQVEIEDKLTRLQYLDTKLYLPGDILVKVDRMSMANSLETRAPLLDYRLVEFAWKLPSQLKIRNGISKYLLKKLLRKYIPEKLLVKKKRGFAVPINHWFQTTLNGYTKDILLDSRFTQRGLFRPKVVAKVLDSHAKGRHDYSTWIWMLLNLELWFQTFVDSSTRKI